VKLELLFSDLMTSGDVFRQYAYFVSLDVISDGKYKTILQQGCVSKQVWAIKMQNGIDSVNTTRKAIIDKLFLLKNTRHNDVLTAVICVMNSNNPPSTIESSQQTCFITKEFVNESINVTSCNFHSKKRISNQLFINMGKHLNEVSTNSKIYISERFQHFFMMVWYMTKLDYLIKSHAKWWLIHKTKTDPIDTVATLCNEFCQDDDDIDKFYQLFENAVAHITNSMHGMEQDE
jgi:hypothetical protein